MQAQALIDQLGMRNVLVRARQLRHDEMREARKKSLGVSLRDADGIKEAVPGVELVGPRLKIEPWRVQAGDAQDRRHGVRRLAPAPEPGGAAAGRGALLRRPATSGTTPRCA